MRIARVLLVAHTAIMNHDPEISKDSETANEEKMMYPPGAEEISCKARKFTPNVGKRPKIILKMILGLHAHINIVLFMSILDVKCFPSGTGG